MGDWTISINDIGTFEHELGHLLWSMTQNESLPNNWSNIINDAKNATKKGYTTVDSNNLLINVRNYIYNEATREMENFVVNKGYKSIDDYVNVIAGAIEKFWNNPTGSIKPFLKNLGMSDNVINQILHNQSVSFKEMASMYVRDKISTIADRIARSDFPGYTAFSDIVDAVFLGADRDLLGNQLVTTYRHGLEYYKNSNFSPVSQFHEIIANFNELKMLKDQTGLYYIKELFGEDFYNVLEDTYNKMRKYGNLVFNVDADIQEQVQVVLNTLFSGATEPSYTVLKKISDGIHAINDTGILDALNKNESDTVLVRVIKDLFSEKISIDDIDVNYVANTLLQYVNEVVNNYKQSIGISGVGRVYDSNLISGEAIRILGLDKSLEFGYYNDLRFSILKNWTGDYGIDQATFKKLKTNMEEYNEMKKWIKQRYNLSSKDATKIMSILDSIGACSYADACNEILLTFSQSDAWLDFFEKQFGFPLLETMSDGSIKVNSKKLLMDLYITINDTQYGGQIIKTLPDGSKVIDWTKVENKFFGDAKLKDGNMQQYMQLSNGMNKTLIESYLFSKNIAATYDTKTIKQISYSSCTEMELDKLIDDIEQEMQNGNLISMYLSSVNGPIRLIKADGSLQQTLMTFNNKVSAHAVFVTGISDIGIIVSSWGEKMIVPFSDLLNGGFSVFSSIIH